MSQSNLDLAAKSTGPVECLGQQFPSDAARREHYLKLLAQKLKDPDFRKIEGFPTGKDEDILALSDPPYYTACPNPWLGDFVKGYGSPYNPKQSYHREPFTADVSEGKNHPIYNAHGYHTKVPHRAIMRYILHYTQPGDVVYDGFCGTGMTGVAAQLCGDRAEVQELGYIVKSDGTILDEDGQAFSKVGARRAILSELSPAAAFIAYNYNSNIDVDTFENQAEKILREVEEELGWVYHTLHSDGKTKGTINFTVWSQVFSCPECASEIIFWDAAVDRKKEEALEAFPCPKCSALNTKRKLQRVKENKFDRHLGKMHQQDKFAPVLINYSVDGKRYEKRPDISDLAVIRRAEDAQLPGWVPTNEMPDGDKMSDPFKIGIRFVHQFYTPRNLLVLSAIHDRLSKLDPRYLFWFTSSLMWVGRENRLHLGNYFGKSGGVITSLRGTWYVASLSVETSVLERFRLRIRCQSFRRGIQSGLCAVSNTSSTQVNIPDDTLDYIFLDPPFGSNLMYSELNIVWESWLKVITNKAPEAIENNTQNKHLTDYRGLMQRCFYEAHRQLKPGRWITIEFSNTSAAVWNTVQAAVQEVGFIVANVSVLNKQKGSFNAVNNTTSVKQDLVISAYKPNGGLEARFSKRGETEEGVWDFINTHLQNLPVVKAKGGQLEYIAERDPRILYDRMVAFYVGHSTPVPLSSAEFQAGLAEKFPEREGMVFLPEQVNEYDKKRAQVENIGQLSIFVEDERSAINWLRNFLKTRPSVYSDIVPDFMQQLSASWKKWEAKPALDLLLDQNFLCYDGTGDVPSQIHSYLSTQFKDSRKLEKADPALKVKAKNRWYVPDPKKNVDVETLRNKRLLEEFWSYLPEGYTPPALSSNKGQTLPGLSVPRPKIPKGKKLKELRTEAVRVGFKHCYQLKDYTTILVVAEMIPESVLNEDEQLQMIYDTAITRSGGAE